MKRKTKYWIIFLVIVVLIGIYSYLGSHHLLPQSWYDWCQVQIENGRSWLC